MRSFEVDSRNATNASWLAVAEWLSQHEGHGIQPLTLSDIRRFADREVFAVAFKSRQGMSFAAMLDHARALVKEAFARLLLEDEGEGGLTVDPPEPADDGGVGGVGLELPQYPEFDLDELRRISLVIAARLTYESRYREDVIAAAVDDGVLYALVHYNPERGDKTKGDGKMPLSAWVAVCARNYARQAIDDAIKRDGRERFDLLDSDEALTPLGPSQTIDPAQMKFLDDMADDCLTEMEYAAYIAHRCGLPAGGQDQRDALKRAKAKLRRRLLTNGYGYEDFFIAA